MKELMLSALIKPMDVIYTPFGLDRRTWVVIVLILIAALATFAVLLAVRAAKYLKRLSKKQNTHREGNDDE